jgi:MFS family permease
MTTKLRASYRSLPIDHLTTYQETEDIVTPSDEASNSLTPSTEETISIDEAVERLSFGRFHRQILCASGLCYAADGMQVILLTFLAPVLQDEWNLSRSQAAGITSALFAGSLFGALVWGPCADRMGRRPVFLLATAVICVSSSGTSLLADRYGKVIATIFGVGFGVGGLTIPFDILAEFLPTQSRGKNLIMINYTWTLGVLYVVAMAYFSLRTHQASWRVFTFWCSFPSTLSFLFGYMYVPESPRWLATKGRMDEALNILRKAALINGNDSERLFPATVTLKPITKVWHAKLFELLQPQWRNNTLRLWGAWFTFAFGYYGTVMLTTRIFSSNDIGQFDYNAIFVSTLAEFLGTTLGLWMVDRMGRIPSQVKSYLLAGLFLLAFCVAAEYKARHWILLTFGFVARIFEMAATCMLWVSTAEIFNTEMRGAGHSSANALARIGAFFCPLVVENSTSLIRVGILMLFLHSITAFCVSQLPETMGREMGFAVDERIEVCHRDGGCADEGDADEIIAYASS